MKGFAPAKLKEILYGAGYNTSERECRWEKTRAHKWRESISEARASVALNTNTNTKIKIKNDGFKVFGANIKHAEHSEQNEEKVEFMLNVLLSGNNRAVEDRIFECAIASFAQGEEVYILVPEQFTLQNEIRLMDRLEVAAVSRIQIMSFERLAREALSRLGGIKRAYIDRLGKTMLIKSILGKYRKELPLYHASVDKEGFTDSLLSQITELKRARIDSSRLSELSERLKEQGLVAEKLKELAIIFKHFEDAMQGKYVDNEDRLSQLSELGKLEYLSGRKIYIYSFLDFTKVEEEIIEQLLRSGAELTIGLCLDPAASRSGEESVFAPTKRTLNTLRATAHRTGIAFEETALVGEQDTSAIAYLGDQLFRTIPIAYAGEQEQIGLFAAHSIAEELEQVALDISRRVVEEGFRYCDFMLATGELAGYSSLVKQIFEQYDIPYFIDEKRDMMSSPIVKMIVAALQMLGGDFSVEYIMSFLKNDLANESRLSRIYDFENYLLAKKLRRNMIFEDRYFTPEPAEQTGDEVGGHTQDNTKDNTDENTNDAPHSADTARKAADDLIRAAESGIAEQERTVAESGTLTQEVIDLRNELIGIFAPFSEKAKKKQTAQAFGKLTHALLEAYDLSDKIGLLIKNLKEHELLDEANENGQIWNIFVRVIEQCAEVFGEEEMDFATYKGLILSALSSHKLAVIPPTRDQVIVGDIDRSRSDSKKILYLCGTNAGSIPKIYREAGLLTQEDKLLIAQEGTELASEQSRVDQNQLLLIYLLLTRATEYLHISYSVEAGKMPSPLIAGIRQIFPALVANTMRDREPEELLTMPRPTTDRLLRELKGYSEGKALDPIWKDAFAYYYTQERFKPRLRPAIREIFGDRGRTNITGASELYRLPMRVSTTRLRGFAECPFKHFVQYGLRARERREYVIEPAEIGLVLHSAVEELVGELKKNPSLIDDMTDRMMDDLMDDRFDLAVEKNLTQYDPEEERNKFLLKRIKRTAKQIGMASVEHIRHGRFILLAQEARFGEDGEIPPIILDIDGQEVILTGTIDRIDVLESGGKTYIKVIDYKTGSKEFSLSDAYTGLDIQLLVYLSAVRGSSRLIKTPAYPAGAFYFPITRPTIDTEERSKEELEKKIKEQIKMDGIVLDEDIVLHAMDEDYDGSEKFRSKVYARSKRSRITHDQLEALLAHTQKGIQESVARILDGEIDATPIRRSDASGYTACTYCRYGGICRFEGGADANYRIVHSYKDEEVLKKLVMEK